MSAGIRPHLTSRWARPRRTRGAKASMHDARAWLCRARAVGCMTPLARRDELSAQGAARDELRVSAHARVLARRL